MRATGDATPPPGVIVDSTPLPGGVFDAAPLLSVVVVSWNAAADLGACLESAFGARREIVVVDNGSTDRGRELVQQRFPDALWLANDANLGFARAANRGLRAASGRYVLFLNPDARADDAAIAASIALLERRPEAGLVSVAIRDASGAPVPTVEPFFSLRALARSAGRGRAVAPAGSDPVDVDWSHGAFLLGRREDLLALGGFDERFFLYAEDMDLCLRVHESGKSVVYLPGVSVVHRGNASGERLLGENRAAAIFASQLAFYRRRHGVAATAALRAAAAAFFGARAVGLWAARSPLAARYRGLFRVALLGAGRGPLREADALARRAAGGEPIAANARGPR